MIWFLAVVIVLIIGGVVVVAFGAGSPLAPAYDDRPDVRVPADRPLTGADVRAVRFTTTLRGYRASEVDALLARLATQVDARANDPVDAPAPRHADTRVDGEDAHPE